VLPIGTWAFRTRAVSAQSFERLKTLSEVEGLSAVSQKSVTDIIKKLSAESWQLIAPCRNPLSPNGSSLQKYLLRS